VTDIFPNFYIAIQQYSDNWWWKLRRHIDCVITQKKEWFYWNIEKFSQRFSNLKIILL